MRILFFLFLLNFILNLLIKRTIFQYLIILKYDFKFFFISIVLKLVFFLVLVLVLHVLFGYFVSYFPVAGKIMLLSPSASNSLNAPLAIHFLGCSKSNDKFLSANAILINGLTQNASPLAACGAWAIPAYSGCESILHHF